MNNYMKVSTIDQSIADLIFFISALIYLRCCDIPCSRKLFFEGEQLLSLKNQFRSLIYNCHYSLPMHFEAGTLSRNLYSRYSVC